MVRAYHLILTAYGFWLPNDPRGSWSNFVGAWDLLQFGRATKVDVRYSVASTQHDHAACAAAKAALKHSVVLWNGLQARAIARGFAHYVNRAGLGIYACGIMPDHAHLVIGRHELPIESIANQLKGAATRAVTAEGLHLRATHAAETGRMPKMFARGHWAVFLDEDADVQRAIQYVNDNPIRARLKPQRWSFVRESQG